MKPRVSRFAIALLVLLVGYLALARRDFSRRNARIFPEMADSPAAQSLDPSGFFADGRALRDPVPGTIPRGFKPASYGAGVPERDRAGRELTNPEPVSLGALERGHAVYENFCLHCHGPSGQGDGAVARRASAFAMSIVGKATLDLPDGAIFHIISHGQNNMPAHGPLLGTGDRWSLVRYVRDMQADEMARLARLGIEFTEDPRRATLIAVDYGLELYDANCAVCHGAGGRNPRAGVPTLNSSRVLAVANADYYVDIITHGRKGSEMLAWDQILTPSQISSLASYIRSWAPSTAEAPTARIVEAASPGHGRQLFRGNCAACHGPQGEGGIGASLRSPSFQAVASDRFLTETILRGRDHTAMPAGYEFTTADVGDLLAFVRAMSPAQSTYEDVEILMPRASAQVGAKIYRAKCASCHGLNGEGGLGARLASDSFLSMADDRYLYRAITEGRPGTAMPAWHFLASEDVADVIAYVRGWQRSSTGPLPARARSGRADFGELLYKGACVQCHGPAGAGGVGNQIANRVFLDSASNEFLWRSIAYGKDGSAMRGFLKGASAGSMVPMASEDIDHLIAYLRRAGENPPGELLHRPLLDSDVALGKFVYEERAGCASCHGLHGEGASAPALANPDFLAVASDGYLTATIVMGREHSEMLPFYRSGMVDLSQREVAAVAAYVRSFEEQTERRARHRDLTDIARIEGRELWLQHCAACHGTEGHGPRNNVIDGYAPSINTPEFLAAADDGFLLATIAMGRPGTPMRAFGRGMGGISDLEGTQIKKIVAYIRSWGIAYTEQEEAERERINNP